MWYQISVWRRIQVFVEVEAQSETDALSKYESGDLSSEEEIVDSSDIDQPSVFLIKQH